ncbi:uncharacterized protein [Palaemon carinicauda]|uniref:uncharacterized protein n=1 Tax=Palaemon carinicauda TaxID=392227 RepID=UPI0035B669C5
MSLGKRNPVADALPRNTLATFHLGLDCNALADAQLKYPEYHSCRTSLDDSNATLLCDVANLLGIILYQITGYNPATKGMVERFHRTLPILMSCSNDSIWFTQLPWVLLGLVTTPKDALEVSAAEMVYGNPLIVSVKFVQSATSSQNLQCLHYVVRRFTLCRQTYKQRAKQHTPTDLLSAMHVFMCNDTSKPPLMPPFKGPFLLICGTLKAFLINNCGKEDWVPIDRL